MLTEEHPRACPHLARYTLPRIIVRNHRFLQLVPCLLSKTHTTSKLQSPTSQFGKIQDGTTPHFEINKFFGGKTRKYRIKCILEHLYSFEMMVRACPSRAPMRKSFSNQGDGPSTTITTTKRMKVGKINLKKCN